MKGGPGVTGHNKGCWKWSCTNPPNVTPHQYLPQFDAMKHVPMGVHFPRATWAVVAQWTAVNASHRRSLLATDLGAPLARRQGIAANNHTPRGISDGRPCVREPNLSLCVRHFPMASGGIHWFWRGNHRRTVIKRACPVAGKSIIPTLTDVRSRALLIQGLQRLTADDRRRQPFFPTFVVDGGAEDVVFRMPPNSTTGLHY